MTLQEIMPLINIGDFIYIYEKMVVIKNYNEIEVIKNTFLSIEGIQIMTEGSFPPRVHFTLLKVNDPSKVKYVIMTKDDNQIIMSYDNDIKFQTEYAYHIPRILYYRHENLQTILKL